MIIMQKCILTVILMSKFAWEQRSHDYWSEDYDQDKNCESPDLIKDIEYENPDHCVYNAVEDPNQSLENCKRSLTQQVMRPCMSNTNQSQTIGTLLYCHSQSTTACCIHNFTCNGYKEINANIKHTAKIYLTNKELYLGKEAKNRGFKNCYPIKGLDASKCGEECKSLLKTSPLLDHCNKKKGLLKCCVRRDKVFCDECRYCCTLPFCSYKDENGDVIVEGEDILKTNQVADQEIGTQAVYQLQALNSLYKGYDNRCLKPDENKSARKWDHYDPDDFYNAVTEEELKQAKTKTFDKNFFNFEDPKVLKKFTDPKNTKIWKKTYGFDYVHVVTGEEKARLYPETFKACVKTELKSSFAKKCRKDNGLFKCCNGILKLGVFEEARQHLYNNSLIESVNVKIPNGLWANVMTYSCTRKNEFTGDIITSFKTPEVNPIGGSIIPPYDKTKTRIGFRSLFCKSLNLCLGKISGHNERKFYDVSTREEYCQLENDLHSYNIKVLDAPEGLIESVDSCMKRKSVVRICPKKVLKALNDTDITEKSNKILAFNKKLKRKKKKKGSKKKKKKMKKRKKLRENSEKTRTRTKNDNKNRRNKKRRNKKRKNGKKKKNSNE